MKEQEAKTFQYRKLDVGSGNQKSAQLLAKTDLAVLGVQTILKNSGAKNNLHYHTTVDGFWMVLHGHAEIYTAEDRLIADLGPMEGVVIPRDYPMRIESVGDEDLEIMKFEATDSEIKVEDRIAGLALRHDRVDLESRVKTKVVAVTAPPAGG